MGYDMNEDHRSLIELPFGSSSLILRPLGAERMTAIEVVHEGERLVLGLDVADRILSNFLAGLDPTAPHREMETGRSFKSLLGRRCFYFQGLASTSAIYGAYLPSGILRLVVQGSQMRSDLEVVIDLTPADRETWRDLVTVWFARS